MCRRWLYIGQGINERKDDVELNRSTRGYWDGVGAVAIGKQAVPRGARQLR